MMDPSEYERKKLIRNLVESKHFDAMIEEIRQEIAMEMINCPDPAVRETLYNDNRALERLVGKLVQTANEVRMVHAA